MSQYRIGDFCVKVPSATDSLVLVTLIVPLCPPMVVVSSVTLWTLPAERAVAVDVAEPETEPVVESE